MYAKLFVKFDFVFSAFNSVIHRDRNSPRMTDDVMPTGSMSQHTFCFSYKIPVYFKGVFHNDFKETSKYTFDEISIVAVQIIAAHCVKISQVRRKLWRFEKLDFFYFKTRL